MSSKTQYSVILTPGEPGKHEPYAKLEDGRVMPMGFSMGETFKVGDQGMAEYITTSSHALWRFEYFGPADDQSMAFIAEELGKREKVVEAAVAPTVETLQCKAGHSWTRPKAGRGRKPLYCPEHQPTNEPSEMQTLRCKHGDGHEWTREPQRGKPPEHCPAHQPQPQKPANGGAEADSPSPGTPVQPRISLEEIMEQYHPQGEDLRKLTYIDQQLRRGRESNDVVLLLKVQKDVLRKLQSARTYVTSAARD